MPAPRRHVHGARGKVAKQDKSGKKTSSAALKKKDDGLDSSQTQSDAEGPSVAFKDDEQKDDQAKTAFRGGAIGTRRRSAAYLDQDDALPSDLASKKLPMAFVERLMADRVRDSVLIRELVIFIPFLLLFLFISLAVIDVEHGHHVIGGLKDLTMNKYFPDVPTQNRSIWQMLTGGQPIIYDPDTDWRGIGEQGNWVDWTGFAVRKLFQCTPDELPHESLAAANVNGFPMATAGAAVSNQTNSSTGASNSTVSNSSGTITILSSTTAVPTTAPTIPAGEQFLKVGDMSGLAARDWLPSRIVGQLIPVGALRLRAQLVRNDSCSMPGAVHGSQVVLNTSFNNLTNQTDATFYHTDESCYHKDITGDTELRISPRCYKTDPLNPAGPPMFQYKQCSVLGAFPTTTELNSYHCGGYTYDIPFNLTCTDALRVLYQLTDESCPFVDHTAARFFILEYFVYAPEHDTFASVKHVLELTAGGAWIPSEQFRVFAVLSAQRYVFIVFDFIFLVYVLYYIIKFFADWVKFYKQEGRIMRYLFSIWTFMEGVNTVTYIAVFVIRWMWWGYSVQTTIDMPYAEEYPEDLERLLITFSSMRYAMAVNFILTFLKMLKFLKISDRLAIVSVTFEKAQTDVLGLLAIFVIVMLGFGVAGNTLFGAQLWGFAALDRTFSTLMFMLLGEMDYPAMKIVNPTLAGLYFWAFLVVGFFLVLNFIVAVISDAFTVAGEEQFVAPLADSIIATIDDIIWAMSPSTIKLRCSLASRGKTQYALEKHMYGYMVQHHAKMQLKGGDLSLMVSCEELYFSFPATLRRDGQPFFLRFWQSSMREYALQQETVEAQIEHSRQTALVKGVRAGLGMSQESSRELCLQMDRANDAGDRLVALLNRKFGDGFEGGAARRPGSPSGASRPGTRQGSSRGRRGLGDSSGIDVDGL